MANDADLCECLVEQQNDTGEQTNTNISDNAPSFDCSFNR